MTVGWDFTWTSTPILDGPNLITPWLLVSNADFVLDSGVNPVGVFTPFITLPSNYTVVGPDAGNGEVNPWSQPFDTTLQTGIASYSINPFQSFGDLATGNIVLTYDEYRVSPNDPSFNPITDTIATGLTVRARTSVLVANPSGGIGDTAPEPPPGGLLIAGTIALLVGLFRGQSWSWKRVVPLVFAVCVASRMFGATAAQQAELTASDPSTQANFGDVIAMDGNLAVIGARGGAGEVYVFTHANNAWSQTAGFQAADTESGDLFGSSVALNNGG